MLHDGSPSWVVKVLVRAFERPHLRLKVETAADADARI
jgi:hypothetical protein